MPNFKVFCFPLRVPFSCPSSNNSHLAFQVSPNLILDPFSEPKPGRGSAWDLTCTTPFSPFARTAASTVYSYALQNRTGPRSLLFPLSSLCRRGFELPLPCLATSVFDRLFGRLSPRFSPVPRQALSGRIPDRYVRRSSMLVGIDYSVFSPHLMLP